MPKTYRALVGIDYVPDDAMHKRLVSGEDVPWEDRGTVRVKAGATFSPPKRVIDALILGEQIEEVDDDAP